MVERKYVAKKRAVVKMLAIVVFIWVCLFDMLYLLVERKYPPTTESILSASLVVLSALIIFWTTANEIYRMLYTPQIIIADTVLILDYGKIILNWEDIIRINISRNFLTITKRGRIFRVSGGSIRDIANKHDLIKDVESEGGNGGSSIANPCGWVSLVQ